MCVPSQSLMAPATRKSCSCSPSPIGTKLSAVTVPCVSHIPAGTPRALPECALAHTHIVSFPPQADPPFSRPPTTHTHPSAHTLYWHTTLRTLSPETYHSFHTLLSAPYPSVYTGKGRGQLEAVGLRRTDAVGHLGPSSLPGHDPASFFILIYRVPAAGQALNGMFLCVSSSEPLSALGLGLPYSHAFQLHLSPPRDPVQASHAAPL